MIAALGLAAAFGAGGYFIGKAVGEDNAAKVTVTEPSGGTAVEELEHGKSVFASAGCAGCHTFAPAGATGNVGPALDGTKLTPQQVVALVRDGRGGMPPFGDQLAPDEIADVAAFVTAKP